MKKILFYITCALAVSAFAAGCSDDDNDSVITNQIVLLSGDDAVIIEEGGKLATFRFEPLGSSVTLNVTADTTWEVLRDATDEWCHFSVAGDMVTFSADEFASDWTRTAVIKIKAGNAIATVRAIQSGTEASELELSTNGISFAELGGRIDVEVYTNKDEWYVTGQEKIDWIEVEYHENYFTVIAEENLLEQTLTEYLTVIAGTDLNFDERKLKVTLAPWSTAYFEFVGHESPTLALPEFAVDFQLEVNTNRKNWEVSTSAGWFNVEKTEGVINITSTAGTTSQTGTIEVTLYDTDGTQTQHQIEVTRFLDYMILETSPLAKSDVYAPYAGQCNLFIDWGDGTYSTHSGPISAYGDDQPMHTYLNNGVYDMKIYGTAVEIHAGSAENHRYITAVKKWADMGVTNMWYAFANTGIKTVAPLGDFSLANVTNLQMMFYGCQQLEEIPADLFKGARATGFSGIFSGCSNLKSIPVGLFDDCVNAENFASAFRECSSLTSVPEGLFDNCPDVDSFFAVFMDCSNLTSVPVSLFDNNRKVTGFANAFYNCSKLNQESPYWVNSNNGAKVHLYERSEYPAIFTTPTWITECFAGATSLTDYNNIPDSWKVAL